MFVSFLVGSWNLASYEWMMRIIKINRQSYGRKLKCRISTSILPIYCLSFSFSSSIPCPNLIVSIESYCVDYPPSRLLAFSSIPQPPSRSRSQLCHSTGLVGTDFLAPFGLVLLNFSGNRILDPVAELPLLGRTFRVLPCLIYIG